MCRVYHRLKEEMAFGSKARGSTTGKNLQTLHWLFRVECKSLNRIERFWFDRKSQPASY